MNNLLCIVGATATGKTKKALEEAQKTPSIIVSADSRQVYRGMDIVTGKDHPRGITLYGIDIVDPDEECSVAVWYEAVIPHIKSAWDTGKQVIVVGGTGLYVQAITDGIDTMQVGVNAELRAELAELPVPELQKQLATLSPAKFESLNHSDKHNPRRLIRAIEVYKDPSFVKRRMDLKASENIMIGLKYFDDSNHRSKIYERVKERIKNGAIQETERLLKRYDPTLQSMSAIGYKHIIAYLAGGRMDSLIESWVRAELQYAKRQMTWFKKKNIIWYDGE
jgi:tRNA dimethylallyltransferase